LRELFSGNFLVSISRRAFPGENFLGEAGVSGETIPVICPEIKRPLMEKLISCGLFCWQKKLNCYNKT